MWTSIDSRAGTAAQTEDGEECFALLCMPLRPWHRAMLRDWVAVIISLVLELSLLHVVILLLPQQDSIERWHRSRKGTPEMDAATADVFNLGSRRPKPPELIPSADPGTRFHRASFARRENGLADHLASLGGSLPVHVLRRADASASLDRLQSELESCDLENLGCILPVRNFWITRTTRWRSTWLVD